MPSFDDVRCPCCGVVAGQKEATNIQQHSSNDISTNVKHNLFIVLDDRGSEGRNRHIVRSRSSIWRRGAYDRWVMSDGESK
jgi:hypothetical protein